MLKTAVLILIFVFGVQNFAKPEFTRAKKLAVFDDVWQTIADRYYDPDLRGIDWSAERDELREKAAAAKTQTEFYAVLRELINDLQDSHTRVFAPGEETDWKTPRVISVGVTVREIENELVVTRVEEKSLAKSMGVRAGDLLLSVNDIGAKTAFEQKINEMRGSSTPAIARLQAAAKIFDGAPGTNVKICWQNEKARERCARLSREWRATNSDVRVRRVKDVLVLGFDVFTFENVSKTMTALQRENQKNLRGIILDLRANRGGTSEASIDFASAFLPEKMEIGNFIDRDGRVAVSARTRQSPLFIFNSVKISETPVTILIGTATASAAEIFVAALKKAGRAKLIGAQTCGCVLAVRRQHALPDGGTLEISELDFQLADGKRIEGNGIAPDETVEITRRDIIARRDAQLEAALARF
jgi:carboxyl-terminal processing protease